ncbi:MAG: SDR family oxidoreductase [Deltaproteobacteria bacterium]|nr:SDR family oxidoreductase [Deltaproteobacteria bacterium]
MTAGRERQALVTGGAGFIGSHLVDGLLEAGWRVRVLDDFSSGREANLAAARARIELIRGDLADPATAAKAVAGAEVVFHQGAIPSVPRSVAEPVRTNRVNIDGTLTILEAAREAGVRRVVYAASSSAYGDTEVLPKVETMPASSLSPYALQKYAGEVYCRLYHELYGLETVALRYFNIFGPRQDPKSAYAAVVPLFVTCCLRGEPPTIHGDGEQSRDFTFVADAVRANLAAADAPRAAGQVVNVAGGRRVTLNELLGMIQEIAGSRVTPVHGPVRAGDVRHSLADLGRARALLGWEPATSLRAGLESTVASLRAAGGAR